MMKNRIFLMILVIFTFSATFSCASSTVQNTTSGQNTQPVQNVQPAPVQNVQPAPITPAQSGPRDDRTSDPKGNLVLFNEAGEEMAIFIANAYRKTIAPGVQLNIHVEHAEAIGTKIHIKVFQRSKVTNLGIVPPDNLMYDNYLAAVYSLDSTRPVDRIAICLRTEEECTQNTIGSVLVKFHYQDMPLINSVVSIFRGSVVNPVSITTLKSGASILIPMPIGLNRISIRYDVASGGNRLPQTAV